MYIGYTKSTALHVIIDIETDKLINPTHIWVIVCKDYATGKVRYIPKGHGR